jgi:hypothetical protein
VTDRHWLFVFGLAGDAFAAADGRPASFAALTGGGRIQGQDLFASQWPPTADRQLTEAQRPDRQTAQRDDFVSEPRQNAANLAVLAFREGDLQLGGTRTLATQLNGIDPGKSFREAHTAHQFFQVRLRNFPLHGGQIQFLNAIARVSQALCQLAIVGQEHQPFAGTIQPADREDALLDVDQIDHQHAAAGIAVAREHTAGFVQCKIDRAKGLDG